MSQVTNKISYVNKNIKKICIILASLFVILTVFYIYLINDTVRATAMVPVLDRQIREEEFSISILESEFVSIKNGISENDLEKFGLKKISKVIFIKDSEELALLKDVDM